MKIMHKNFYLALIGISVGGIGFGLVTPITVMLLEQNKAPAIITGSVTMVGYLSVILFSPLVGRLIEYFDVKKILNAGLFIWSMGALAHILWYLYPLLYLIKFFMGIGGTMIFVSTEVIINYYSNENNRGRNINLYAVLLSIGIAIGTMMIWTVKVSNWFPFVISSCVMFTIFILQGVFFEKIKMSKSNKKKMPLANMPIMSLVSAMLYGVFESSIIVVIPLFGLRNNFNVEQVSYLMSSFMLGGILLLYFIGILSDRFNRGKLLIYIVFVLGFLIFLPVINYNFSFLIIVFFLIGGIIPAIYTVGLSFTIQNVDKNFMAQANGCFIMMYGIGTIFGPLIGAVMVDLGTRYGYWSFASLLCMSFFFTFLNNRQNN